MWKKRAQDILTDICKYIFTALILSTLFEGVESISWLMFWAIFIAVACFLTTMWLDDKPKKNKNKRINKRR